jgi:glycine/sarcosine N-methyltransferase
VSAESQNVKFYDDMASVYHLIFEDWNATINRQSAILSRLLRGPDRTGEVLDCACGIGIQALGLAIAGFAVEGSDTSRAAIDRAKQEAASRNLRINFRVDDMRELRSAPREKFGAVIALDIALPHLDSDAEIERALRAMRSRLRSGGRLLVGVRDYGPLMVERPTVQAATLYSDGGLRRVVHQVWDWLDERRYIVHLFITRQLADQEWCTLHFSGRYRAITPNEVAAIAERVGLQSVEVWSPSNTEFYQPIISGVRR